jgi:hypothetical protein
MSSFSVAQKIRSMNLQHGRIEAIAEILNLRTAGSARNGIFSQA